MFWRRLQSTAKVIFIYHVFFGNKTPILKFSYFDIIDSFSYLQFFLGNKVLHITHTKKHFIPFHGSLIWLFLELINKSAKKM